MSTIERVVHRPLFWLAVFVVIAVVVSLLVAFLSGSASGGGGY